MFWIVPWDFLIRCNDCLGCSEFKVCFVIHLFAHSTDVGFMVVEFDFYCLAKPELASFNSSAEVGFVAFTTSTDAPDTVWVNGIKFLLNHYSSSLAKFSILSSRASALIMFSPLVNSPLGSMTRVSFSIFIVPNFPILCKNF